MKWKKGLESKNQSRASCHISLKSIHRKKILLACQIYCRLPSLLAVKRFDGASKAATWTANCTQISHLCRWISSQVTKSVNPFQVAIPTQMSRVLFLATIQNLTQFAPSTVRCEVPDHSSASLAFRPCGIMRHLRRTVHQYPWFN